MYTIEKFSSTYPLHAIYSFLRTAISHSSHTATRYYTDNYPPRKNNIIRFEFSFFIPTFAKTN